MRKALFLILMSFLIVSPHAFANAKTLVINQDCTSNPDLFLAVNGALAPTDTITQMGGYYAINSTITPYNSTVFDQGNTPGLISVSANQACLKQMGIASITLALTSIASKNLGPGSVAHCVIEAQVNPHTPETINYNLHYRNGQFFCSIQK